MKVRNNLLKNTTLNLNDITIDFDVDGYSEDISNEDAKLLVSLGGFIECEPDTKIQDDKKPDTEENEKVEEPKIVEETETVEVAKSKTTRRGTKKEDK